MALRTSKRRPVGTWSAQRRQDAMEQSREAARGPMDLPFLLLTLLLTAMGMVMVLSASFPSAYYENGGNGAYYFIRQGIFALLGLAVMFALSKLNYQRLRGVGRLLLWASLALLVLVIIPHNPIAITENGATRWLGIKGTVLRFQPSEIAKLAVVIYFSATISKKREKMQTWRQGIWPYLLILGVIAGLMMLEPHLSGTILIVCTGIVLMIVGGIKGWLIPTGIVGVGLVGTLYVTLVKKGILHYGEDRINTWRDLPARGAQRLHLRRDLRGAGPGGCLRRHAGIRPADPPGLLDRPPRPGPVRRSAGGRLHDPHQSANLSEHCGGHGPGARHRYFPPLLQLRRHGPAVPAGRDGHRTQRFAADACAAERIGGAAK